MTKGIARNISDTILKATVKYRNHPSIKAIKGSLIKTSCFLLILWRQRKFLRKLVVWITQKHLKYLIYPQKLLKKMLIFFQKSEISRLSQ